MVSKAYSRNYFWVTNISDQNVSLTDLGLSIPARKTVNLLDKRHYSLNIDELEASEEKGSLFAKRKKVVVRVVAPTIERRQMLEIDYNASVPSRRRSVVQIEEVHHEELELSDEAFAEQMSDLTDTNYPTK
jgi:hypothetical protein